MKHIRISQLFACIISLTLLLAPLSLSALVQEYLSKSDDIYIYLGKELSNIGQIIECIKELDNNDNSPLKELHNYIKKGFLFGEYDAVLEVLEYAADLLHSYDTSKHNQLDALINDLECLTHKILNKELTIDSEVLEETQYLRSCDNICNTMPCPKHIFSTARIGQNLEVCGKTTLKKHLNTKQGVHIQGELKVDESAIFKDDVKFKDDVTINGTLTVGDIVIVSCIDSVCIVDLTITDLVASTADIFCDLTVGCNISINDSISGAIGNVIKDGVSFIHTYPGLASGNTFVGEGAGNFTMTGTVNTGFGIDALSSLTTGAGNTAVGAFALAANTAGSHNTAVGDALSANIAGDNNTALGDNTLNANTFGFFNTAVGSSSLTANTTGFENTAVGANSLGFNTTGVENVAMGFDALQFSTIGSNNTAVGWAAMQANTTGISNTAVGSAALSTNTIGIQNTAVGQNAMADNITGSNNIALGINAGSGLTTGINNTYIGTVAVAAGESNITRIRNIYNVTTGSVTTLGVLVDNTGQLGTAASTRKVKHNIQTMDDVSSSIYNLNPVTFIYNSDASETIQYGLIAEEVTDVFPGIVVRDADGQPLSVQYHVLPVLLLNEMIKQKAEFATALERINARLAALEQN